MLLILGSDFRDRDFSSWRRLCWTKRNILEVFFFCISTSSKAQQEGPEGASGVSGGCLLTQPWVPPPCWAYVPPPRARSQEPCVLEAAN